MGWSAHFGGTDFKRADNGAKRLDFSPSSGLLTGWGTLLALLSNLRILLSNLQSFLASVVSQAVTAG